MFGSLGLPEILFILALALLIFGPRKLPEIGRTLGRALGEFRRATTDLKRSIDVEMELADAERTPPKPAPRSLDAAGDGPSDSASPQGGDPANQPDSAAADPSDADTAPAPDPATPK